MVVENTFTLLLAFLTILFSLLVLFNIVKNWLRLMLITSAIICFLLFGYSLVASLKTFFQGYGIQTARSDYKTPSQLENREFKILETENELYVEPKIIEKEFIIKESVLLDIPVISQLPELPRGCEVTSLAMLLQNAGVNVDKMELGQRIEKDPTPYQMKDGQVFFGHPNVGFVGDMYNIDNPGYGVYHKPIKELADKYLPERVVDLTGSHFSELEKSLSNGFPVWIIINSWYSELPPEQFRTWNTPAGEVLITYREHSVLITGFDKDFVYVNDPLTNEKNKKIPNEKFLKAWVQMGCQAITYVNS